MFNLSKKKTSMIQVWVCVLLTVLALALSFMPIVKLKTIDHKSDIYELMDTIGIEEKLPEEVEISAVGLIKSGKLIVDIISTATGDEADDAKLDALQNKLSSEDAKKTAPGQHTPHNLRKALSWHTRYLETGTMQEV